jgi:glycosyltransferase involved in cell wall biosynthesis
MRAEGILRGHMLQFVDYKPPGGSGLAIGANMRVLAWMNFPSHHQRAFYAALRTAGVDLEVCYYAQVPKARLALGWEDCVDVPPHERYVSPSVSSLDLVRDWRQRIHIIPGCGELFLWRLIQKLCSERCAWIHWSERARSGIRWWAGFPRNRFYATLVNRFALGAFGTGELTVADLARWGMRGEKLASLPYSVAAAQRAAAPDPVCESFRAGRNALLFLGNISEAKRKGLDILLKAFAMALARTPGAEWVLFVVGDQAQAKRSVSLAKSLGIQERVLFRSAAKADDVSSVMQSSAVLVLPSRYDGWGVVLNEAASMGRALIASDSVGAAYDLIRPGQNGFRVETGNVTSLANAIRAYFNDATLAKKHGDESLRIAEDYLPHRAAERFRNAIESWQAMTSARLFASKGLSTGSQTSDISLSR